MLHLHSHQALHRDLKSGVCCHVQDVHLNLTLAVDVCCSGINVHICCVMCCLAFCQEAFLARVQLQLVTVLVVGNTRGDEGPAMVCQSSNKFRFLTAADLLVSEHVDRSF